MVKLTVLLTCALATAAPAQYLARGYADPRARIDELAGRIDHGVRDGSLDRGEARSAFRELDKIRSKARDLYRRDHGQLSGGHQEQIERRLDDLSRRLRWDRRTY
jgi:hypothetical protein